MSLSLQVIMIISCVALFCFVIHLITKGRLVLKYALIWLVLSIVILICSVFPGIIIECASIFGFTTPSNFIFLVGAFFLLAITLSLSVIVSWQSKYIRSLVQTIAILDEKISQDNSDKR